MPHLYDDYLLGTTRFNEKTAYENERWRDNHKWKGCIYAVPKRISLTVPNKIQLVVIEMLNLKPGGKILGFGLITNFTRPDNVAHIYSDKTYNRFIYNSNFRIDISKIPEKYTELIKLLEGVLFYGSRHMKRGQGITVFNKLLVNTIWQKKLDVFFKDIFTKM